MKSIFIFAATLSFMVYIVSGVISSPERQGRRRRQSDCDFACTTEFRPVCGSDGKNYSNACELRRADCLSPAETIRFVHNGPCISVCLLPKVVGPCRARLPRYYYNGRCELFYYGGCRGNGNNFRTIAACEAACIRRQQAGAGDSKPV